MKIIKYTEFIKEELMNDSPETYIREVLKQLKKKIDKIFDKYSGGGEEKDEISIKDAKSKGKNNKISLNDLGLNLESCELSLKNLSLKVIFTDEKNAYDLYVKIDVTEGIPKEPSQENFSAEDVKKCKVKFRKYDKEILEPTPNITRDNVNVSDINEDFLVLLKTDLDDLYPDDDDFEIETE
jgi:hypothetical protein